MKIFFITAEDTYLADAKSAILKKTRKALLKMDFVKEVREPALADVFIIQERFSYKDFRYIQTLLDDPFISKYLSKIFTLNFDDCATGMLRGLYSNIPRSRLNNQLHRAVPYMDYFNELVFSRNYDQRVPKYLATWRGNQSSNKIRPQLITLLNGNPAYRIEVTGSWLNHPATEKTDYIDLMLNGKFALCPAGLAASSFRIYESMALGICPVIIADEFATPHGPDWKEFALFLPEENLPELDDFLLKNENSFEQLGIKAKEAWNNYFREEILPDYYAKLLLELIHTRVYFSNDSAVRRWKSKKFYHSNNWTLQQRMRNKLQGVFAMR